ncbi:MAG TPA: hypothetical protein VKT17_03800, partial [Acidobacteriota bacterium]|nr:hypothetical protein [Acidobacteriota bacterium]
MRKAVAFALFMPLFLLVPVQAPAQTGPPAGPAEAPSAFVERLQGLLRSRDLAAYLEVFRPEVRPDEKARLGALFDELKMTSVSLRAAGVKTAADGPTRVFVQAFFENEESAIVESWTLTMEKTETAWSVAGLDVTGTMTRLYKIRIPSGRAVRARRVEVRHADVR